MQTNPNTPIQKSITVAEFNRQVQDWTYQVRSRALTRLAEATTGEYSGKAKRSFTPSLKYDYGEAYSTGFKFAYYLVFIHYGVGRGYIHKNGTVIRGRLNNNKYRTYRKGKPAKTWKSYNGDNRPIARYGFDWLDIEVRNAVDKLADIAANYHGDKAAKEVMKDSYKLLIDKTNG
ncbi:hypothetical protein A9168_08345 [Macellibacteroides sp. HH-ZS]|nr:hypothetical protein A9168_08345 [Macellibacteroides sp. HH-ZS]